MLDGKKILLGVTGSIAAYKAAILVRGLVRRGAEVKVVMTPTAKQFITPLTLATLSKNPVPVEFFNPENGAWNSHVSLGEWADLYIIAPATANTLAKMACGVADNLLLTTYLSMRAPVVVAPAMDLDMYAHTATQTNLSLLRDRGVSIIEPADGELASGLSGKGRMASPEEIVQFVERFLAGGASDVCKCAEVDSKKKSENKILNGRRFLVTAGATIEPIDPVRFISNHSTGKMGYAVAAELAARGAKVTLVSGRTALATPQGVERVDVLSAEDMYRKCMEVFDGCDGAVMCAAVADYTPKEVSAGKIKKRDGGLNIELKRTRDIASALGENKGGRVLVGFALETDDELANAQAKLSGKNFDFVVLNSLRDKGAGFGGDTNKTTFVSADGVVPFPLESKVDVAVRICDEIEKRLKLR